MVLARCISICSCACLLLPVCGDRRVAPGPVETQSATPLTLHTPPGLASLPGFPDLTDPDALANMEPAQLMALAEAIEKQERDKAWVMKRDWTDVEFQDGEEGNKAQLDEMEDHLMERIQHVAAREMGAGALPAPEERAALPEGKRDDTGGVLVRAMDSALVAKDADPEELKQKVLNNAEVLGSSLDMAGAYLKNYEIDKAARVVETIMPACRARGGLWLLKALNFLVTVRMKQARPAEALEALQEVEALAVAGLKPEEEATDFYETLYRNFAWILSSLDRREEAIEYSQKAVEVKTRVGGKASWFDYWDLGREKSAMALKSSDAKGIEASRVTIAKALELHREAEPKDLTMRAKIWNSVGECSFALGHLAEKKAQRDPPTNGPATSSAAIKHYRQALKDFIETHKLFKKTEGRYNPLTGGAAEVVAWTMMLLGKDAEAKEYLLDFVEALSRQQSGWGDGFDADAPALARAVQGVDRILEAHRRPPEDRAGMAVYFPALERLVANVRSRLALTKDHVAAPYYEKLVSSSVMVMVAAGTDDGTARGQKLLRGYLWKSPSNPQAQLLSQMLLALPAPKEQGASSSSADSLRLL